MKVRKCIPALGTLAIVVATLTLCGATANGASTGGKTVQVKGVGYLGDDWLPVPYGPDRVGKAITGMAINLDYTDFGVIPKMTVTLYLPKGVSIVRQKLAWVGWRPGIGDGPAPVKNSRFTKSPAGRPMWVFKDLSNAPQPVWVFWLKTPPGTTKVCVGAVAHPEGKKGAATQSGRGCVPV
ncbi:MAG TPA: hypothetical protein VHD84_03605 [Candidatus Saccharimonadales bacterium]|nr:hypothetical protein [Candidatus Saccharimonadales bacterium]